MRPTSRLRFVLRWARRGVLALGLLACLHATEEPRRRYDLPAGEATGRLREFSAASGREILFASDAVRGVTTSAVHGDFTAPEALAHMLAATNLYAWQDAKTGALAVRRKPAADTAPAPAEARAPPPPPFEPQMKSKTLASTLAFWIAAIAHGQTGAGNSGMIEGRVYNVQTGEYVEKARITVEGTTIEAFTDASGQYRIANVPAGQAHVRIFFTGFSPQVENVPVVAGGVAHRDVSLGEVVKLNQFVVSSTQEMDGAAIAINQQRFAPNISHVVSAGEFGISADGSVGEFLKFLPGISIDYVGGTANTISMDGVPANYVPVTVAGFDLASTSSASTSRATELLQVSIQNAARLEVLHSPTPESPASALAGSINIVPRSAFERSRPLFTGSVYLMMRDNYRESRRTPGPGRDASYKVQPGFDFSYIAPVSRRFGFTLSGSYSRQFIPQDTSTNTWRGARAATTGPVAGTAAQYPDTTPDKPYLSDFQVSDAIKFNKRSSFGLTLDYKLGPADVFSFSYQYGLFGSESNNNTIAFATNRIDPGNFSLTSVKGVAGRGTVTLTNGHRWRSGETHMPSLIWRHDGRDWHAEGGAGYSHSTNYLRDLSRGFAGGSTARLSNVTVSFDDIFYLRPGAITVTDPAGAAVDPYQLSRYSLVNVSGTQPRDSIDVKQSAYLNVRRDFTAGGIPLSLKAGVDVRDSIRDMRGTSATYNYVGPANTAGDLLDASMAGRTLPYGFPKLEPLSAFKGYDYYVAHPTYFTADPNGEYRNAVSFSKYVEQTVSSAFLRGDAALLHGRLKLIGGVRLEQTNIVAEGPLSDPTRNYQRNAAGQVLLGSDGKPLKIATDSLSISRLTFLDRGAKADKEYFRAFPNLNVSYNVLENLVARAAYYYSIGRPDNNQYAGGITLPDVDDPTATNQRITVNNAGIKPWTARSTKVRLEYYFEGVGQVAIGAFRRDFENFFTSVSFPANPEFLALYSLDPTIYGKYDVTTQGNLKSMVRMSGVEAEYKQALKFLPRWARGVQVFTNFTVLRVQGPSEGDFSGFVPRTYNWGISLNREKFNLRANWNYQGRRRLESISGRSIGAGTYNWRNKRLNLDVQGEYRLSKNLSVFFNLRNVGAASEDFERAGPSTPDLAQFRSREDYGSSWTFGVKGTF
jgi:iron complex outermembrane receptor protein